MVALSASVYRQLALVSISFYRTPLSYLDSVAQMLNIFIPFTFFFLKVGFFFGITLTSSSCVEPALLTSSSSCEDLTPSSSCEEPA